jgi:hypothetical protein
VRPYGVLVRTTLFHRAESERSCVARTAWSNHSASVRQREPRRRLRRGKPLCALGYVQRGRSKRAAVRRTSEPAVSDCRRETCSWYPKWRRSHSRSENCRLLTKSGAAVGSAPGWSAASSGAVSVLYNPLLTALPAVIHLSASSAEAANGSLGALLPIAAVESGRARPGGENVLSRLSELMFVEAIRRYIEMLPASCTGWVAGLRDTILGQALVALHTNRASCGQSNGWHGSWACLDQCLRSDSRRWWVTHQCTTSHSGGCNLLPAW